MVSAKPLVVLARVFCLYMIVKHRYFRCVYFRVIRFSGIFAKDMDIAKLSVIIPNTVNDGENANLN